MKTKSRSPVFILASRWAILVSSLILASARADLVSRWEADGNANDSVGTNNGTLTNGVGFVPGKFGQAFSFNGVNTTLSGQSVVVPDSSSLDLTRNWTLSAWVYTTDLTGHVGGGQGVISKVGGGGGNNGYQFGLIDSATGSAQAFMQFNAAGEGWPAHAVSGGAVSTNEWTFLATSFDGTTLKLYVDGLPVNAVDVAGAPKDVINSASNFRIALDDNGNVPFEGYLDRISVFDNVLTDTEILDLSREVSAVPVPGAVLLGALGLSVAGWRLKRQAA
jgi:hypothetical protein